jgi:hypothetical protein
MDRIHEINGLGWILLLFELLILIYEGLLRLSMCLAGNVFRFLVNEIHPFEKFNHPRDRISNSKSRFDIFLDLMEIAVEVFLEVAIKLLNLLGAKIALTALIANLEQPINSTFATGLDITSNSPFIQEQGLTDLGLSPTCPQQDDGINPIGIGSVRHPPMDLTQGINLLKC